MLLLKHLILGIILAIILLLLFSSIKLVGFLLIIFSAILIDIDHYIYYIFKKNNWNIVKAYKWYIENKKRTHNLPRKEKKKIYFGFHFLHGIEIIGVIYLLYIYVSQIFLYVLIGFSLHLLLDIIIEFIDTGRTDKISVIYSLIMSKKLKFVDNV